MVLSFEVPAAALRAGADTAAEAGCQLVVNPAPVRPRSLDLLANAIVTPNVHELASLVTELPYVAGATADVPELAAALARHVSAVIVTTLGADGARLADPRAGTVLPVPGHRVEVRDATGLATRLPARWPQAWRRATAWRRACGARWPRQPWL